MSTEHPLEAIIKDTLSGDAYFLQGIHNHSGSIESLLSAMSRWGASTRQSDASVHHAVEAMFRQTVLMSLIPRKAFDGTYSGSIDDAIAEHLAALGITLDPPFSLTLRTICLNIIRLRHLDGDAARRATKRLADIRGDALLYDSMLRRQGGRCYWCGVDLASSGVRMSLEHMAPKHIGDDPVDASNWSIACCTCNSGKADALSWGATSSTSGYLHARHFRDPDRMAPEARWSVLVRDRACDNCGALPTMTELWVYRRIPSGLAIPSNCSASCRPCAMALGREIPIPSWDPSESGRASF